MLATQLGLSYKVIFTDFSMPVMDGIQATKKIRQYLQDQEVEQQPAIIGVTGHTLVEYQQQGREAGMNDIVPKPMYIKVLKQQLQQYQALIQ